MLSIYRVTADETATVLLADNKLFNSSVNFFICIKLEPLTAVVSVPFRSVVKCLL